LPLLFTSFCLFLPRYLAQCLNGRSDRSDFRNMHSQRWYVGVCVIVCISASKEPSVNVPGEREALSLSLYLSHAALPEAVG
jgi:hypothetical protein